jgi:hypothetical protein
MFWILFAITLFLALLIFVWPIGYLTGFGWGYGYIRSKWWQHVLAVILVLLTTAALAIFLILALGSISSQESNPVPAASTPMPTMTLMPPPMATPIPPTNTPIPTATATIFVPITNAENWVVSWYDGADKDRGNGTTFRQDAEKWVWRLVAPELWPTFPYIPNPLVPEFRVITCDDPSKLCTPDGLEYAMDETNFCQQLGGEACRVPVAAKHYLYFTGDYDIPGVGSCSESGTRIGCMLIVVNVGEVTGDVTGVFGQGFRLHARYFNGNALDMAIWALASHGSNSMMNLDSELNPSPLQNAGANCSVPGGCLGVDVRALFTSGNEPLLMLTTTVKK